MRSAIKLAVGTALVGFVLFSFSYIPLYLVFSRYALFPFFGKWLSWIVSAWLIYGLVLVILGVYLWMTSGTRLSGEAPVFGPLRPAELTKRTGVFRMEWLLVVAGLVLCLLFLGSAFVLGWASVAVGVFVSSILLVPVERWPVLPRRDIPTIPPGPDLADAGPTISRTWTWRCRARQAPASLSLSMRVQAVAQRDRQNPSRQGPFTDQNMPTRVHYLVTEGCTDRETVEAARQLLAFARNNRFNYFEEAENTLQFVQVIPYRGDQETKGIEYFRFALETLHDNAGDCDCKAILAATLFRLMGLRSVVLISNDEQHAAVAVEGAPDYPGSNYFQDSAGRRYYFCETTDGSMSFKVGEIPPGVDLSTYIYRVEFEPALLQAPVRA